MKKFYFSFRQAHKNYGRYQAIFAGTEEVAYEKMFQLHGREWSFCYTSEQWLQSKLDGFNRDLEPLEPVYAFVKVGEQE